ncbi:MAG: 4-oxalocrotonate tautomerase family protein [Nitrosopumilaceae archaeon]|nr:4-oxalocrotonate tautomerase family protein [Nitrosopumilaceae archaeon]
MSAAMPIVTVSLFPGRSEEQKSEFARVITKGAAEILKAKDEHVIVVFQESAKENWFQAGKPL